MSPQSYPQVFPFSWVWRTLKPFIRFHWGHPTMPAYWSSRPHRTVWIRLGVGILALLGILWGTVSAAPAPELRGVWMTTVDSDVLFEASTLSNGIQTLGRWHFNTLYPTVWVDGYSLYPSQPLQQVTGSAQHPDVRFQGRDLLKELVDQAHPQKMRVIPWFEFGFMLPEGSELARQHPDWLTQRRDGTQVWIEEGSLEKFRRVWLNPAHPQVQQFLVDVLVDMFQRYEIDGIQFDDHIGLPKAFGYDPYTLTLYRLEHQGQDPPDDEKDPDWIRWRADQINTFVKKAYQAIHSLPRCQADRAACVISVAPNPYDFAYQEYLQDWDGWRQAGWMDELIVQIYQMGDGFKKRLQDPYIQKAKERIPVGVGVLSGLKNRSRSIPVIQSQVWQVRQQKLSGVSFFFYESLQSWAKESPQDRGAGFLKLFPDPVPAPFKPV